MHGADTFESFNGLSLHELYQKLRATGLITRLLQLAADEDLGIPVAEHSPHQRPSAMVGDLTTAVCIPPTRCAIAHVVARQPGVVAGLACLPELTGIFLAGTTFQVLATDGESVSRGQRVATLEGPLDEILGIERTMLNLIGRLSGVATQTAAYVRAMGSGHRAKLFDTRKTTPGLRVLEKYAVRCGGGFSHRMGLYDAVLIKDNHLAGIRGGEALRAFLLKASQTARSGSASPAFIEVEVDTLEQFEAVVQLPPGTIDIVLLDNMGVELLKLASEMRDRAAPRLQLEASGGITIQTLAAVAATGVDRISSGALTHSAVQLDFGLDITERPTDGSIT